MYRLISVDLDGTLLNSQKKISGENIEAIHMAIEKGIKVIICSGRVFKGARVFARKINTKEPLVSCNGAVVKELETGKILYSNLLRKEDCYEVVDICRRENIYFHAYMDDDMYTENPDCPSILYWKGNSELPERDRVKINITDDFKKTIEKSNILVSKIVVISEDLNALSMIRKRIEEVTGVDVMSSNFDNFEVVNRGANKGTALKFLSEKLNIAREEIIAIGDNENDYTMLKYAGLSIAMGNAEDSIKRIADLVTLTNDESGVAKAIKKIVL